MYAKVPFTSDSVVDVEKVQRILDDRNHVITKTETHQETVLKTAEGPSFWWLFWILLSLLIVCAILAIICCIYEGCYWCFPHARKRRKIRSAEVSRLVVKGSGHGKESKSVQVAEWFGRREAWTPEGYHLATEVDSLRRHEMERGSDRGGGRRSQRQENGGPENISRDQLYIREGNADILRLITRGNEQQRPVTLIQEQPYVVDSGKDILLRRYCVFFLFQ